MRTEDAPAALFTDSAHVQTAFGSTTEPTMQQSLNTFGAAVTALDLELDWELLGRTACDGDGTTFFDAELREQIIESGLWFADDVSTALGDSRGRSLYVGAEIAELPLILAEHLVMQRTVEWLNIPCPQTTELVRALRAVSTRLSVELPKPRVHPITDIEPKSCDHLWMVSVLSDPDAFPALHDVLYERTSGPLATGRGVLADDRRRADALIEVWLDRARLPCVLSTSDEELTLITPLVARRGWTLEVESSGRLSAIVGDRVRRSRASRPGLER